MTMTTAVSDAYPGDFSRFLSGHHSSSTADAVTTTELLNNPTSSASSAVHHHRTSQGYHQQQTPFGGAILHNMRNTSKDPSSLPDTDTQLRAGIDLIQEAYSRQNSTLKHEISHWKHVATQCKEQIVTLESQNASLSRKVTELERALSSSISEKKALAASKNALMDRFTNLKKSAAQLEAFRKSIVSMVEYSPAVSTSLVLDPDTSVIDQDKSGLTEGRGQQLHASNHLHLQAMESSDPLSMFRNSQHGHTAQFNPNGETMPSTSQGHSVSHHRESQQQRQQHQQPGMSRSLFGSSAESRHLPKLSHESDQVSPAETVMPNTPSRSSRQEPALGSSSLNTTRTSAPGGSSTATATGPSIRHDFGILEESTVAGDGTSFLDDKALKSLDLSGHALDYSLSSIHPDKSLYTFDQSQQPQIGSTDKEKRQAPTWNNPHSLGQTHDPTNPSTGSHSNLSLSNTNNHTSNGTTKADDVPETSTNQQLSSSSSAGSIHTPSNQEHATVSRNNFTSTTSQNAFVERMDAPTLYKHIRDTVSPDGFEKFASAVAAFNAGRMSPQETISIVQQIVGPGTLSDQMIRLIQDAVRD